jgi:hypothetical protein
MDNAAELFAKWQRWINNDLLRGFQNLFIFKHIADGFNESLQPLVGKETDFTDLVVWMSVNYVSNAVTAIRRLGDGSNDVISLHRLLDDVRKHSDVVTPENLSKYRGDIGPWKPKGSVAEALGEDLGLLGTSGDSTRKFVNKMIAHAADDAHTITPPTYGEINDTILTYHRIYRRWALFLAGRGCQTDEPNPNDLLARDPPDYKAQFTTMWNSLGH